MYLFKSSLEKTDYQVVNQKSGEKVLIVPVHEHKIGKQFPDRIVLRSSCKVFIAKNPDLEQ